MASFFRWIRDGAWFQGFIVLSILAASAVVGLRTYPSVTEQFGPWLELIDRVTLGIFVVEIAIKLAAEGKRPLRYFQDGWNLFDFMIVAVCFLPFQTGFAKVLRLLRILRVFRLVTRVPRFS